MYDNPNRYEDEFEPKPEMALPIGGPRTVGARRRLDLPTLGVAAAVYGGWLAATALHEHLSFAALVVAGGWLVAWHGSLQHETIHGRPTGIRALDGLIGFWPLALWLPYARYRETHLAHHRSPHVTAPGHDPESRYLPATAPAMQRRLAALQSTLSGRLLLKPWIETAAFVGREARTLLRGDRAAWLAWSLHGLGVAAVLLWLRACELSLGRYMLCFVAPGAALTLLRSYAEHRADPDPRRRAAIVEKAPVLGLLFLNNNLHALHHARPDLPWWRLPAVYGLTRDAILRSNGGLVYRGYAEVAARFWRQPHDNPVHPGL